MTLFWIVPTTLNTNHVHLSLSELNLCHHNPIPSWNAVNPCSSRMLGDLFGALKRSANDRATLTIKSAIIVFGGILR